MFVRAIKLSWNLTKGQNWLFSVIIFLIVFLLLFPNSGIRNNFSWKKYSQNTNSSAISSKEQPYRKSRTINCTSWIFRARSGSTTVPMAKLIACTSFLKNLTVLAVPAQITTLLLLVSYLKDLPQYVEPRAKEKKMLWRMEWEKENHQLSSEIWRRITLALSTKAGSTFSSRTKPIIPAKIPTSKQNKENHTMSSALFHSVQRFFTKEKTKRRSCRVSILTALTSIFSSFRKISFNHLSWRSSDDWIYFKEIT